MPQRRTPCLRRLTDSRTWARTLALELGRSLVGVRVNDAATATALDSFFRAARRPDLDHLAPANFSVVLEPGAEGCLRPLHLVYRDHLLVARNREAAGLLLDLREVLDAATYAGPLPKVAAAAVVRPDGAAVLLPAHWHHELTGLQRRLADHALHLLPAESHPLGAGGAAILAPARHDPSGEGLLPLLAWAVRVVDLPAETSLRPAHAVRASFFTIANLPDVGARLALDALVRVTDGTAFVGLTAASEMDVLGSTTRLAAL